MCSRNGQFLGNINPGSGQIWLDNVQCTGRETRFTQCRHAGWGRHDCSHSEDVSISCSSPASAGKEFHCHCSSVLCLIVMIAFASSVPECTWRSCNAVHNGPAEKNILIFTRDSIYAIARIYYRLSVRLSVRPSVCHTGGSVENGST